MEKEPHRYFVYRKKKPLFTLTFTSGLWFHGTLGVTINKPMQLLS